MRVFWVFDLQPVTQPVKKSISTLVMKFRMFMCRFLNDREVRCLFHETIRVPYILPFYLLLWEPNDYCCKSFSLPPRVNCWNGRVSSLLLKTFEHCTESIQDNQNPMNWPPNQKKMQMNRFIKEKGILWFALYILYLLSVYKKLIFN